LINHRYALLGLIVGGIFAGLLQVPLAPIGVSVGSVIGNYFDYR
jgi:hypothetical protein